MFLPSALRMLYETLSIGGLALQDAYLVLNLLTSSSSQTQNVYKMLSTGGLGFQAADFWYAFYNHVFPIYTMHYQNLVADWWTGTAR